MTIIHAGVGADALKLAKETVANEYYFFVDPSLNLNEDMMKANCFFKRCFIEAFIYNQLFELISGGEDNLSGATLYSTRMIEHIDVIKLRKEILPLFNNLNKYLGVTINLVYPNIQMVVESLLKNDTLLNHHLCNIEAIAFGDHKTILTQGIISKHFDSDKEFTPVVLDNKPFYERLILRPSTKKVNTDGFEYTTLNHLQISSLSDLSDKIWEISQACKEGLYKSTDTFCISYLPLNNFSDIEICKDIYPELTHFTEDTLITYITEEDHFEIVNEDGSNLFNSISPIYNIILFKSKHI
jgi:hypothetical protein